MQEIPAAQLCVRGRVSWQGSFGYRNEGDCPGKGLEVTIAGWKWWKCGVDNAGFQNLKGLSKEKMGRTFYKSLECQDTGNAFPLPEGRD